jgi:phosphoribosylglycinamide formyltransferase-1
MVDRSGAAPEASPVLRLTALASGRGSNVAAIHDAIVRGDLDAELGLIVSNNSGAKVLDFARAHDIPCAHISGKTHPDEGAAMLEALAEARTDVLVLGGYMKKLDPRVVTAYEGRAVNIHPGPLPDFGGRGMFGQHVHAAVLEAGRTESGPTVHRVTAEYDEGATLGFRPVPVEPGDTPETLGARVLAAEHDLYWRVLDEAFVRPSRSS